jgi:hypothetical protein
MCGCVESDDKQIQGLCKLHVDVKQASATKLLAGAKIDTLHMQVLVQTHAVAAPPSRTGFLYLGRMRRHFCSCRSIASKASFYGVAGIRLAQAIHDCIGRAFFVVVL